MIKLRFKPGDMAILLYARTFPQNPPQAGQIVHVVRVCIITDPWDDLPCHYVVSCKPLTLAGMLQDHVRYVMDCQLMPLGEKAEDEEETKEIEEVSP
jgi:hypothetical protein